MAKAGVGKGGFGSGSKKMGGPGKKPMPPKMPPKMGAMPTGMASPPMSGGRAAPPMPAGGDTDMDGYRKGGMVRRPGSRGK